MTALAAPCNATSQSILVDTPEADPTYPFFRSLDSETIKIVGNATANTWEVERGVGDTQATTHPAGTTLVADTSPFGAAEGGGGAVLSVTVTLTDAQIKALPSTPIEVVPAGAGTVILPVSALVAISDGPGYTNVHADAGIGFLLSGYSLGYWEAESLLTFGTAAVMPLTSQGVVVGSATSGPDVLSEFDNQPLRLYVDNSLGALTGGDAANTLTITVLYTVLDLA